MRFLPFVLLGLICAAAPCFAANSSAAPVNRDQSMIETFRVICTKEAPDFDHINSRVASMHMAVQSDTKTPEDGDTVTRSKSWFGNLSSGPVALLLDETAGPKGTSTSCAVVGDVPAADDFHAEAVKKIDLPDTSEPTYEKDGSRTFTWNDFFAPETVFVIRDFKSGQKSGVMMKVTATKKAHE